MPLNLHYNVLELRYKAHYYYMLIKYASFVCRAGRKEDVLKKYPEFAQDIEFFIHNDPSHNLKYLDWELKMLKSRQALAPEINDVVQLFHKYSQSLKQKDINQYKPENFTQLRDKLFDVKNNKEERKEKIEQRYHLDNQCDAPIIYEDDQFIVRQIKNKAASIHYGARTKWCITMKNKSYFEDYDMNNVVFFFVFRKEANPDDPLHKVAIAIQRDEDNNLLQWDYFDAEDKQISKHQFLEHEFSDASGYSRYINTGSKIIPIITEAATATPKSDMAKLVSHETISADSIINIYNKYVITKQYHILGLIVEQPNTPSDIFYKIYTETKNTRADYRIQQKMADNQNLPPEILSEMSNSDYIDIRSRVAANPNTPTNILDKFLEDKSSVLASTLRNPGLTSEQLMRVGENPEIIKYKEFAKIIAAHPNTPSIILKYLAYHYDIDVRAVVARNSNTPQDVLSQFVDDDPWVQYYLAHNPKASPNILTELAKREDDRIKAAVARNPNTPKNIVEHLLKDPDVILYLNAYEDEM